MLNMFVLKNLRKIEILILVTAICKQKHVIFNPKLANRLALLTKALRPHGFQNFLFEINDMRNINIGNFSL